MRTRKNRWSRATSILPVPTDTTGVNYQGSDLLHMTEGELRRERHLCIRAIEIDAPLAHGWYFDRLRKIDALLRELACLPTL